jgi:uncharacterized zinc-type alcohol dehydrogenase-like protein
MVVNKKYILKIRPQLDLAVTAPLLCVGITLYSPLRHWKAPPLMAIKTQRMLDYSAEKNITSDIEMIPMQKIIDAHTRLLKEDVKYRFVFDIASLK